MHHGPARGVVRPAVDFRLKLREALGVASARDVAWLQSRGDLEKMNRPIEIIKMLVNIGKIEREAEAAQVRASN